MKAIIGLIGAGLLVLSVLTLTGKINFGPNFSSSIPWLFPIAMCMIAITLLGMSWGMNKKVGWYTSSAVLMITVIVEFVMELANHTQNGALVWCVILFFVSLALWAQGTTSQEEKHKPPTSRLAEELKKRVGC